MLISEQLKITEKSEPPMRDYDLYFTNRESLDHEQNMRVIGFAMYFTALQKQATIEDTVALKYMSKYYSYFCEHYKAEKLPSEIQTNFKLALSGSNTFMNKALGESSCHDDFLEILQ